MSSRRKRGGGGAWVGGKEQLDCFFMALNRAQRHDPRTTPPDAPISLNDMPTEILDMFRTAAAANETSLSDCARSGRLEYVQKWLKQHRPTLTDLSESIKVLQDRPGHELLDLLDQECHLNETHYEGFILHAIQTHDMERTRAFYEKWTRIPETHERTQRFRRKMAAEAAGMGFLDAVIFFLDGKEDGARPAAMKALQNGHVSVTLAIAPPDDYYTIARSCIRDGMNHPDAFGTFLGEVGTHFSLNEKKSLYLNAIKYNRGDLLRAMSAALDDPDDEIKKYFVLEYCNDDSDLDQPEHCAFLIEHLTRTAFQDENWGSDAINYAVRYEKLLQVRLLWAFGAQGEWVSTKSWQQAFLNGDTNMIQFLLEHHVFKVSDVTANDINTYLFQTFDTDLVDELLEKRLDIHLLRRETLCELSHGNDWGHDIWMKQGHTNAVDDVFGYDPCECGRCPTMDSDDESMESENEST